jgi:hypothetical protein
MRSSLPRPPNPVIIPYVLPPPSAYLLLCDNLTCDNVDSGLEVTQRERALSAASAASASARLYLCLALIRRSPARLDASHGKIPAIQPNVRATQDPDVGTTG